jgi:hypothetical protein
MRCMNRRCVELLLGCGMLLVLAGCAQKFTRERFDMIQPGVDEREDVTQILGKPEAVLADIWYYGDLNRHTAAQIFFADDGRVLGKEWMDADTGEWDGNNPHADAPPQGEVRERRTRTRKIDD